MLDSYDVSNLSGKDSAPLHAPLRTVPHNDLEPILWGSFSHNDHRHDPVRFGDGDVTLLAVGRFNRSVACVWESQPAWVEHWVGSHGLYVAAFATVRT